MTPLDEPGLVSLAAAERAALVRFARHRLGGREDEAEDAVQEALIRALRAVRGGARPENGRGWLYTILAHCCADSRTTAARRLVLPLLDEVDVPDGAPSVTRTVEARAEVAATVRAIAALPVAQRDALVGFELGGATYEELGERHGWSLGATKSLIWRARARLTQERAGWAALGAPFAALRSLFGHAEKPLGLLVPSFGGEALGCVTAAVLGAAAIGLPATASRPVPAPRAPTARVTHATRSGTHRSATSVDSVGLHSPHTSRAAAQPSANVSAAVAACAAGRPLAGHFTPGALLRASHALPTDVAEYTSCPEALDRALLGG